MAFGMLNGELCTLYLFPAKIHKYVVLYADKEIMLKQPWKIDVVRYLI